MAGREQDIRNELSFWKDKVAFSNKNPKTPEGVDVLSTSEYKHSLAKVEELEAKVAAIDEGRKKTQEKISMAYRNNTSRNNIKK